MARGLVAYTNQLNFVTQYAYDEASRKTFETNANSEVIRYTNNAARREQLEKYLETRRGQEDGDEFKAIRRGWCLGDETFRKELLESVEASEDEPYRADARRETTEEKARRILNEELDKLGWTGAELAGRAKGNVRKIRIARRLRAETAVTLKWTHVANRLSDNSEQPDNQPNLNLCQK